MRKKLLFLGCVIFAPYFGFSQDEKTKDLFAHDSDIISTVYTQNIIPYIERFAEKQFPPIQKSASEIELLGLRQQVRTFAHIHETQLKAFMRDHVASLKKEKAASYTKADRSLLMDDFDFALRVHFLYLDHEFYEETRKELNEKFKS